MSVRRAYRILLHFYPNDFQARFGTEMLNSFEEAADERHRLGRVRFVRFFVSELAGLVIGAGIEWMAKLTTRSSERPYSDLPDEVIEAQKRIASLINHTVHAIANHDFPGARLYSCEEREARENLQRLWGKYRIDDNGREGCL